MRKRVIVQAVTFLGGLLIGASASAVAGTRNQLGQDREPLVLGIGGVFLKAQSPETLQEWYRQHLGLEPGAHGIQFPWRQADEPSRIDRTVWSLLPRDTDYFGSSEQQFMVNYIVRDLDLVLSRLAEGDIHPVKQPEEYSYGRFAWVLDGEGNRIELWEPPEVGGQGHHGTDAGKLARPPTFTPECRREGAARLEDQCLRRYVRADGDTAAVERDDSRVDVESIRAYELLER
ncbi:MAG: VOC family protein [Longimicrobiales bacterium]